MSLQTSNNGSCIFRRENPHLIITRFLRERFASFMRILRVERRPIEINLHDLDFLREDLHERFRCILRPGFRVRVDRLGRRYELRIPRE